MNIFDNPIMSDLNNIAYKHLERATKLQETSLKYIIAFGLLILFCWVFAEHVFRLTKYDSIRLNLFEQRADSLGIVLSTDFRQKQSDKEASNDHRNNLLGGREALTLRMREIDSAYKNEYQAVEENLPSALKFVLRQATHRPYGILLTALTTFGFLWYLFDLRKRYCRRLSLGLRILKEENAGYNKIYDYNLSIPFWAFPMWRKDSKNVSAKDVMALSGLARHEKSYNTLVCLIMAFLLVIQGRLFYISLITNGYRLSWILVVQAFVVAGTIALIAWWLLPTPFNNRYNKEVPAVATGSQAKRQQEAEREERRNMGRRNWLIATSTLLAGGIAGYIAGPAGRRISASMLQPRTRSRKKVNKNRNVQKAEAEAQALMAGGQTAEAARRLGKVLEAPRNRPHLANFTRLFDMMFVLCQKETGIHKAHYATLKRLANNSGNKQLIARVKCWETMGEKKRKKVRRRGDWDGKYWEPRLQQTNGDKTIIEA